MYKDEQPLELTLLNPTCWRSKFTNHSCDWRASFQNTSGRTRQHCCSGGGSQYSRSL